MTWSVAHPGIRVEASSEAIRCQLCVCSMHEGLGGGCRRGPDLRAWRDDGRLIRQSGMTGAACARLMRGRWSMPGIVEATLNSLAGPVMALAIVLSGCSGGSPQVSSAPPRETQSAPPAAPVLPSPTTENQPRQRSQCGQQVCLQSTTIGDLAAAWSISVNHAIMASNLCTFLLIRCESYPYANAETAQASIPGYAARQRCLRALVEDTCAHTNCQEEFSESDLARCNDRLWVSTCSEMLANSREIMACSDLPAPACTMPRRDPYDPSRQNICEGVAEQLLECGHPSALDGCEYTEGAIRHCMAQSFAPEKWEGVASCMDPEKDPESGTVSVAACSDRLACIKRVAPVLVE